MAISGRFKFAGAMAEFVRRLAGRSGDKTTPTHATIAEQARESRESEAARNAQASIRDRMVDVGRGNQQAGRQGQ